MLSHGETLPAAKSVVKRKRCWWKMDSCSARNTFGRMAKSSKKPPPIPDADRPPRVLFLGLWLRRLGKRPVDVARAAHVGESYISSLISGKKKNPGIDVLLDISEFLEISINDLYRPPPAQEMFERLQKLTPSQIATLGQVIEDARPKGRGPPK